MTVPLTRSSSEGRRRWGRGFDKLAPKGVCLPSWPALLALLVVPAAGSAPRVEADLRCESFGTGPQLECRITLGTADGRPLTGARVTLSATMPAMPMAHHVRPAVATPTATPGEYRARLELEMAGIWSVQTDVEGPARDRVARTLLIEPCAGERRCPASAASARSPSSAASVASAASVTSGASVAHAAPVTGGASGTGAASSAAARPAAAHEH